MRGVRKSEMSYDDERSTKEGEGSDVVDEHNIQSLAVSC